MAFCAGLNGQHTTWIQFTKMGEAGDGVQCAYVYMTGAEFVKLHYEAKNQGQIDLLNEFLAFDPGLFSEVFLYGLLVFVTGLSIGLILSIIRKAK